MLKSIFAKYVITFTVLLLVSFLLLLFIVDSVATNYALRAERREMGGVVSACAEHLGETFALSGHTEFADFLQAGTETGVGGDAYVHRLLDAIMTNFDDMTVYVTDETGGFIFSTGKAAEMAPSVGTVILGEEERAALVEGSRDGEGYGESDERTPPLLPKGAVEQESFLKEALSKEVLLKNHPLGKDGNSYACALPVWRERPDPVGNPVGYVVVVTTAESWSHLMDTTVRSVTVATLWIFLAALIAIYFITERTVAPLRAMSRAVKRMAVGQYDVRVRVYGKDEVAQLAAAFNQMAESLENLEHMRNSFVANVSHDLRTPMTTIAGFVDGILDGVIPPEQQEHYLQVVSGEVRRLSRLVTALLDVSRLQAGDRKFEMKPFDICEMGRKILISFEQKIDEKGLDVEFMCEEDNMYVLADRDAIYQIFYNICDNAVKFASQQGKLRMTISWQNVGLNVGQGTEQGVGQSVGQGVGQGGWSVGGLGRSHKAEITVYNEGQGIPPEDIPFIFERFYKSDKSRSLDKSGVGLGMYIAKTIIDAHGESLSVNSEYGRYCAFTFTLARTDPPSRRDVPRIPKEETHE